jgi:glycosyl transferase family 25
LRSDGSGSQAQEDMQRIPVYVVSLERARQRRALLKAHLGALKIDYELIDAVEGAKLDPSQIEKMNPNGNLSPAALGCYLSHIRVYERIVETQTSVALVLEDDTVLSHGVKELLENGCQSLDFDYCFLGSADYGDEGFVFYDADSAQEMGGGFKAYLLSSGPYCLNAYLITLQGAKKRIACALPARTAIDHYHFLPYRPRFRAIIPMLAFLSEQTAIQSMASETWTISQKRLHRYWWFYPLRDFAKLKSFRKWLSRRRGNFTHASRWQSFSSAFRVAPRKWLEP